MHREKQLDAEPHQQYLREAFNCQTR